MTKHKDKNPRPYAKTLLLILFLPPSFPHTPPTALRHVCCQASHPRGRDWHGPGHCRYVRGPGWSRAAAGSRRRRRRGREGEGLLSYCARPFLHGKRCWHAACLYFVVQRWWCRQRGERGCLFVSLLDEVLGFSLPLPTPILCYAQTHTQAASSGRPPLPHPPPAPTRRTTRYVLPFKKERQWGRAC